MKPRLMDHLVCPMDKTFLELREWESLPQSLTSSDLLRCEKNGISPDSVSREIVSGLLINHVRKIFYPIYRGVPRLLTFPTDVFRKFQDEYQQRIRNEFAGYELPSGESMPGEADVLRTFSAEWLNYDWDGQAYWNLTPEGWFKCMSFALRFGQYPANGKLALEVGIGIGGVADFVSRSEQAEVVGIDLGHAVDVANTHFSSNPFLHIAQASAFAPPFADRTFDLVYSWGVIHHTFSTKTAFDSLAKLPKEGGRLYIWVYSPHDENRTFLRKTLMAVETVVRPVMWRLPGPLQTVALSPFVPLYMAHQLWQSLRGDGSVVRYGVREAMHAARDRLTPRFIHRHTDAEVEGWFRSAGYDELSCDSGRERPSYVPEAFTACTGVSGIRKG